VIDHACIVVAVVVSCSVWRIWFDDSITASGLDGRAAATDLVRSGCVASFFEQEVSENG
jgi:hypothetical protein